MNSTFTNQSCHNKTFIDPPPPPDKQCRVMGKLLSFGWENQHCIEGGGQEFLLASTEMCRCPKIIDKGCSFAQKLLIHLPRHRATKTPPLEG